MRIFACVAACLLAAALCSGAGPGEGDARLTEAMKTGGHILMIRHALAPGIGDPENFVLGDCSTQRNLNRRGREQARAIGRRLRSHGIDQAAVYSSQWCRCLETAKLLGMGPVKELPALNSFFERPRDREPNLKALREFIAEQPPDGRLIIMVTHQVTISAVAEEYVSSGEGVLLRINPPASVEVVARLDFGIPAPRP